jgi:hypothetical protein
MRGSLLHRRVPVGTKGQGSPTLLDPARPANPGDEGLGWLLSQTGCSDAGDLN